jgi:hypothetical protein
VSLVSITSGGKPDSKASCLIGGLVGEGPTTQPYLWLDLNERCDQMQETQPYAGDRGQISARGREVLAKLIRPFGRLDWTGLTVLAATNVRAVPKEASKYGAVGGTKLFLAGRISAGGEAISSRASNLGIRPQLAASLWRALKLAPEQQDCSGVLGRWGAFPALALGAVALPDDAEARRHHCPARDSLWQLLAPLLQSKRLSSSRYLSRGSHYGHYDDNCASASQLAQVHGWVSKALSS